MPIDKEPPRTWIDDQMKNTLKEQTDFLSLLRYFGATEIKKAGGEGQYKAKCIFPDCEDKKNQYHLGINNIKKVFNCFKCGRQGDILRLIMLKNQSAFYDAKKFLLEWNRGKIKDTIKKDQPEKETITPRPEEKTTTIKYKPFRRRLTGLRVRDIPILEEKGLEPKTCEKFGVGYCSQGMMKGRIVAPIHDSKVPGTEDENILAYAGYSVTRKQKEYGDWKFPDSFEKGKHLFNLNRVTEDTKHAKETLNRHGIILVESFWSVLKLTQASITNVVALMGAAMTTDQEKLLLATTDKIKLWLDDDEAGKKAIKNILRTPRQDGKNGLLYKAHVKVVAPELEEEKCKPYQFAEEKIKEILTK